MAVDSSAEVGHPKPFGVRTHRFPTLLLVYASQAKWQLLLIKPCPPPAAPCILKYTPLCPWEQVGCPSSSLSQKQLQACFCSCQSCPFHSTVKSPELLCAQRMVGRTQPRHSENNLELTLVTGSIRAPSRGGAPQMSAHCPVASLLQPLKRAQHGSFCHLCPML